MRVRPPFVAPVVLAFVASPAVAESIVIVSRQPAKSAEAATLRKLVIVGYSGEGGSAMTSAITQQVATSGPGSVPYFNVVNTAGRTGGVGILSGNARIQASQRDFTRNENRCVEGAGFFSCKRREQVTVSCTQRQAQVVVDTQIIRASDRRIVYATSKPYNDVSVWCEGQAPAVDPVLAFNDLSQRIAQEILQDIAPYDISYKVRLVESTKGLSKDGAAAFKAAVKIAPRNLVDSCAQFRTLASKNERNGAVTFALGLCAEQAGDLIGAMKTYVDAQRELPSNTIVAESQTRIRNMTAARLIAEAQEARRAGEVAAERRQAADAASTERAAEAAAKRKARQREAAAASAKAEKRAAVVKQYGAGAADAVMSGTVRVGMSAAAVRAATGGGCRIQSIGPGEEQWYCRGKRIVFLNGRVNAVR